MGLRAVAAYSDADARALHVAEADEAVQIGPAPPIDSSLHIAAILDAARRTGYSRFPVIGDSADDIRGVVHIKKAVAVPADRRGKLEAGAIMTDVLRVPETIHLDSLLAERRANRTAALLVEFDRLDDDDRAALIAALPAVQALITGKKPIIGKKR